MFKKFSDTHGAHVIIVKRDGKETSDNVIKLLSGAEFSVDELNEIQKALDSKR